MRLISFFLMIFLMVGCDDQTTGPINQDRQKPAEGVKLETLAPGSYQKSIVIEGLGKVLYAIQIPQGYDSTKPVPLVLVLHYGYQGSKPTPYTGGDLIKEFAVGLAPLNAIVIAPDVMGGNWTSSKNEEAAIFLTRSVMKSYAINPKKVVVTGFSMGGAGTWFLGSRHADLFTGAIAVAAPLAGNDKLWKIPVYVIHSEIDESVPYRVAEAHYEELKEQGLKIKFDSINDLTHYDTIKYAPYVARGIDWLESEWRQ